MQSATASKAANRPGQQTIKQPPQSRARFSGRCSPQERTTLVKNKTRLGRFNSSPPRDKIAPMKASVFIATSLDGFIARADGGIDWLGEPEEDGEDYGFGKFFASVDTLVMGRNSFEKVMSLGSWFYGTTPVVVLTHRSLDVPAGLSSPVIPLSGSPAEVVEELARRGAKHLYIDGGKTVQAFLEAHLIQRIIITRIPVLLGEGIPLFGPLQQDIKLRHIETRAFDNGLVQSEYEVIDPN